MIESVVEERSKDIFILNQQKDFIAHFYKYGFVGVMLDWIDSGMDEDYQMILFYCKFYLKKGNAMIKV